MACEGAIIRTRRTTISLDADRLQARRRAEPLHPARPDTSAP